MLLKQYKISHKPGWDIKRGRTRELCHSCAVWGGHFHLQEEIFTHWGIWLLYAMFIVNDYVPSLQTPLSFSGLALQSEKKEIKWAFQISANKHITVPTCVPILPSFLLFMIEVNAALCWASYLSLRNLKQMSITSLCCTDDCSIDYFTLVIRHFAISY